MFLSTIFSSNCRKLTKYYESAPHAMAKQRNIASVLIISRKRFLCVCANYPKRKYSHIPKTSRSQGPSFLQITIASEKNMFRNATRDIKRLSTEMVSAKPENLFNLKGKTLKPYGMNRGDETQSFIFSQYPLDTRFIHVSVPTFSCPRVGEILSCCHQYQSSVCFAVIARHRVICVINKYHLFHSLADN